MGEVAKSLGGITAAFQQKAIEYPLYIETRTAGFYRWRVCRDYRSAGSRTLYRCFTRKQAERFVARKTWSRR